LTTQPDSMKAVQTFWTDQTKGNYQLNGGWLDARFHWMSWALSSSLLHRHFGKVTLYTDQFGKQLLTDWLELPFDEVHLTQDDLALKYPSPFWVMRKLHTYSQMTEPFLHVDSDAFLWQKLPPGLRQADVVVQNVQEGFSCYPAIIAELRERGIGLPDFVEAGLEPYTAVNMGIVGGSDVSLFRPFFEEVDRYLHTCGDLIRANLENLTKGYLNTLWEECFFFHYLKVRGKVISPLISQKIDQHYAGLGNLLDNRYGYSHLIGAAKQNLFYCKLVEQKLRHLFPGTYARVVRFIDSGLLKPASPASTYFPFAETQTRLRAIGDAAVVTPKNYAPLRRKYLQAGEDTIGELISYEADKHRVIGQYLRRKRVNDRQEQARFDFCEKYLAVAPLQNRLHDEVSVDEAPSLFCLPAGALFSAHQVYASLVVHAHSGSLHAAERLWSSLALRILCTAVQGKVSLRRLCQKLVPNPEQATQAEATDLFLRIDVLIRELYWLGLLAYTVATDDELVLSETTADDILATHPGASSGSLSR
jgi:hypothetical protein